MTSTALQTFCTFSQHSKFQCTAAPQVTSQIVDAVAMAFCFSLPSYRKQNLTSLSNFSGTQVSSLGRRRRKLCIACKYINIYILILHFNNFSADISPNDVFGTHLP